MSMWEKFIEIRPEVVLLIGAVAVMAAGLWRTAEIRKLCPWLAALALAAAFFITQQTEVHLTATAGADGSTFRELHLSVAAYFKLMVCAVGLLLLVITTGLPERLMASTSSKSAFDPQHAFSGEFYAFFLLSLAGVMLTAGAADLVWLFLALELVSLPTYIMVAISRKSIQAREAAVKYFFLGALAAAVFLYGFALIYGATGQTDFAAIRDIVAHRANQGEAPSALFKLGLILALVGVGFKIAAVPMHFYVADVYQGAAAPVTAFLALVPKAAGFAAMLALLSLAPMMLPMGNGMLSGGLPAEIRWLIWIMAAATMTAGNVLGLLQTNVKRALAYSSVAHSGYMLVALAAVASSPLGQGGAGSSSSTALDNGAAAILFYLAAYGVATLTAFAVLAVIPSRQAGADESQEYADIAGAAKRHPIPSAILLISLLSLIGLPPFAGFVGKLFLFGAAINLSSSHPELLWLVVIGVLNSAIAAVYYLRIAAAVYFGQPPAAETVGESSLPPKVVWSGRLIGAGTGAILAIVLGLGGSLLVEFAHSAAMENRQTIMARLQEEHRAAAAPVESSGEKLIDQR